ncbi:hypothetical protein BB561_001259 [Smittium simulii]|uniref:CSC1/OSCA1-like 7TM region domain-containing protein n=1 Tax=Smittium simulii TaxID=133385 RepID=A0A2T9YVD1_9FUNG|nr:hypothetical protein BB561_001259 [Smittium simulii]
MDIILETHYRNAGFHYTNDFRKKNISNYFDPSYLNSLIRSGSQDNTKALWMMFVSSIVMSIAIILLFSILRLKFKYIFSPRTRLKITAPPELPKSLFGWFMPTLKTSDVYVLNSLGLDAYISLRFYKMCARLLLDIGLIGIIIVYPINVKLASMGLDAFVLNSNLTDVQSIKELKKATILLNTTKAINYRMNNHYMLVHIIFSYVFTAISFYHFKKFTSQWASLRWHFLMCSRNSTVSKTVLLKKIPKFLAEKPESLKWMWEQGVGIGNIEKITVCPNETAFLSIIRKRAQVLSNLESEYKNILGNPCSHPEYDRTLLFNTIMADTDESRELEEQLLVKWAVKSRIKRRFLKDGTEIEPELIRAKTWIRSNAVDEAPLIRVDKLDYLRQKFLNLDKIASEVRLLYKEPNLSSNAFITFEDAATAHMVCQLSSYPNPSKMIVSLAPEPRSIYWENITMSSKKLRFRKYTKVLMLIMLMLLWVPPVIFVGSLLSPATLSKINGLQDIFVKYPLVRTIVLSTLPPMVLVLFFNILPWILKQIVIYGGAQSFQMMDFSVMCKTWLFLVYNVVGVLCISGSFWDVLVKVLDDPRSLLQKFADTLPRFGSFFTYYVLILGVLFQPLKMLQLRPVLWHVLRKWVYSTPREHALLAAPVYIDWYSIYPYPMLVFTISMLYSTLSPIVVCVAIVYFSIGYLVLKYQLLYVYFRNYESCGMMWPKILIRMTISIILFEILTTFFVMSKTTGYWGLSMVPLLVASFFFLFYYCLNCKSKYEFIPMYLWRHPPPNTSYPPPPYKKNSSAQSFSTSTQVNSSGYFNDIAASPNAFTPMSSKTASKIGQQPTYHNPSANPALFQTPNKLFRENVFGSSVPDDYNKYKKASNTSEKLAGYSDILASDPKLQRKKIKNSIHQPSLAEIAAYGSMSFLKRLASTNNMKLKSKFSSNFQAGHQDPKSAGNMESFGMGAPILFGSGGDYIKGHDIRKLFEYNLSNDDVVQTGKKKNKFLSFDANIPSLRRFKSNRFQSKPRLLRHQSSNNKSYQKTKSYGNTTECSHSRSPGIEITSPLVLNNKTATRLSLEQIRRIEEMVLYEEGFSSSQNMEIAALEYEHPQHNIMKVNSEFSLITKKKIAKVKNRFQLKPQSTQDYRANHKNANKKQEYTKHDTCGNLLRISNKSKSADKNVNHQTILNNRGINSPLFLNRSSINSMVLSDYDGSVASGLDSVMIKLPTLTKLSTLNIHASTDFTTYSDYNKYRKISKFNTYENRDFGSLAGIPASTASHSEIVSDHRGYLPYNSQTGTAQTSGPLFHSSSSLINSRAAAEHSVTKYRGNPSKLYDFGYCADPYNKIQYEANPVAAYCMFELNRANILSDQSINNSNGNIFASYEHQKNAFVSNNSLISYSDFNSSTDSVFGALTGTPSVDHLYTDSVDTLAPKKKSIKKNFIKLIRRVLYNDFNPATAILDGSMDIIFSNTSAQLVDYNLGTLSPLKYKVNYDDLSLSLINLYAEAILSPKRKRLPQNTHHKNCKFGTSATFDSCNNYCAKTRTSTHLSNKMSLVCENNGHIKNFEFKKYFDTNVGQNNNTDFFKIFHNDSIKPNFNKWSSSRSGLAETESSVPCLKSNSYWDTKISNYSSLDYNDIEDPPKTKRFRRNNGLNISHTSESVDASNNSSLKESQTVKNYFFTESPKLDTSQPNQFRHTSNLNSTTDNSETFASTNCALSTPDKFFSARESIQSDKGNMSGFENKAPSIISSSFMLNLGTNNCSKLDSASIPKISPRKSISNEFNVFNTTKKFVNVSNYQKYSADAQHELLTNNQSDYLEPPMQTVYGILDGSVSEYFHPGLNGNLPQLWLPVKYTNKKDKLKTN